MTGKHTLLRKIILLESAKTCNFRDLYLTNIIGNADINYVNNAADIKSLTEIL